MTKENMLLIAERNLKKAKNSLKHSKDRPGITENELENLNNNLEYAETVYKLIIKM